MTKNKAINQLKSLIEHFNNGANDVNNDDIDAIKYILNYINKPTIDISSTIDLDPNKIFESLATVNAGSVSRTMGGRI